MRTRIVLLFLILIHTLQAAEWQWGAGFSQGYTHYQAKELNSALILLERQTNQVGGFNPYSTTYFDGHPINAFYLGLRNKKVKIELELEYWVESFKQTEVPFDQGRNGRSDRINCDTLRQAHYSSSSIYGCVEARETFAFLPFNLQLSHVFLEINKFNFYYGGGAGILAGSSTVELKTDYFGAYSNQDDKLTFSIYPGVQPVLKVFAGSEWQPYSWLGVLLFGGLRYTQFESVEVRNTQGGSKIGDLIFEGIKNGSKLYLVDYGPSDDKVKIGTEAEMQEFQKQTGISGNEVGGDFSGWYLGLRVNGYWGLWW